MPIAQYTVHEYTFIIILYYCSIQSIRYTSRLNCYYTILYIVKLLNYGGPPYSTASTSNLSFAQEGKALLVYITYILTLVLKLVSTSMVADEEKITITFRSG